MIADKTSQNIAVTGNLNGEEIEMSVDQESMGHIMSVLTNLYSDKILAIIREYSTNARDAHIAAGITRAIEVTLPSQFSPHFTVKDFGVGLSVEDIRDIYSKYGASSKRSTNDQVGMLGLGCKSALTYTDQFTVTSVKDGRRVMVAVSRNIEGGGSMTVVDDRETDDENGTIITVPAQVTSYSNPFKHKADEFFSYWEKGTILLDGIPPKHFTERFESTEIAPSIYLVDANHPPVVVMGNVAYPAEIEHSFGHGKTLVAFVGIGDVTFPPSREALQYNKKTRERCDVILEKAVAGLQRQINKDIGAAKTHREAVAVYMTWSRRVPATYLPNPMRYGGKEMPSAIRPPKVPEVSIPDPKDPTKTVKIPGTPITWMTVTNRPYKLTHSQNTQAVAIENAITATWIENFDAHKWTPTMRKKLDHWRAANSCDSELFVFTKDAAPKSEWIDKSQLIDWSIISAIKLPKNHPGASGRIAGSYDLFHSSSPYAQDGIPSDDIDADEPIYYFVGAYSQARHYYEVCKSVEPDCTLVYFNYTREAKFQRTFPEAKKANAVVQGVCDEWMKSLNKLDRMALTMRQSGYNVGEQFKGFIGTGVKDPALLKAAQLANRDITKLVKGVERFSNVSVRFDISVKWEDPMRHYPLFDTHNFRTHKQHVIDYLNDAYERRVK